mmetsp:Transcript_41293/g.62878  ORF Transcript_41293/g.62878 Transcript_41293/m.62878 type:complete len:117 (+) Transcript_41293:412-762(+)
MQSMSEIKKSPIHSQNFIKPPADKEITNAIRILTDIAGKYRGSQHEENFHRAVNLIESIPKPDPSSTLEKAKLASQREYNIITNVDEGGSLSSQRLLDFQPGTGGSLNKKGGAPSS